jgi:Mannosyl-glycoprotein endo-beta-N-acetylglucosaminidase
VTPASPRRPVLVSLAAAAVAIVLFVPGGAAAQTAPPAPPAPTVPPVPPAVTDQLLQAAIELSQTATRLDQVAAQVAEVQVRLQQSQAALADVTARANATQAQIDQLKAELGGRAALVYEQQGSQGAVLRVQHVVDIGAADAYTNAAATQSNDQLDQLSAAEAALQQERAQRAAEEQSIADDELKLQSEQASLQAVRARDQNILGKLGGVPIMGDARLTADQLAAWFHSTGQVAHLAGGMSIEDLTKLYIQEGGDEHVAGDLAFAQAIIETGSFGHALDSNFAGIGACDSCTSEIAFPSPRDGVRAQIQLLRSYADPSSRAALLKHPPEPALFGSPPAAAAASYDSFAYKGAAPLWNVMGNGKWATDPDYSTKILELYARMVGFATQHG